MMPRIAIIACLVAGCASTDLAAIKDFTADDVATACRISREYGDAIGERCFCTLAAHEIIVPKGLVSTVAISRAERFGRPPECAVVELDAKKRLAGIGILK